ncbi:hypothetical protein BDY19DRAFT_1057842 [Irpex rosettiformis]|uniref:Uncharacterized protein n=1 Tax=Irpex rosettiformis TaxID=378272 RepID=A0ACB8U111_9APHY|nr:hypothetical protein BDY19DRAFT_1057842 [Irpex rosettiformis]
MSTTITTLTNTPTDFAIMLQPQDLPRHATVDDLPNELLLDVTTYLSFRTIVSLRQVNRRWRAIVSMAATAGLPESTRGLLRAWFAWTALSLDAKLANEDRLGGATSPINVPRTLPANTSLTDTQRDRYVTLVGRYTMAYQSISHEEPSLSDEFLEWLYEWPSHASLPLPTPRLMKSNVIKPGFLSPSSVVNALTRSASYCTNPRVTIANVNTRPSYYYQSNIIFLIALEDDDILLPRVRLYQENKPQPAAATGKGKQCITPANSEKIIKCSMLDGGPGSFAKGDWARFLPISTVRRAPGSESPLQHDVGDSANVYMDQDCDPETPLPLYVLSGSGLGEKLTGSVCALVENAELRVIATSWADYLLGLAEWEKGSMQIREKQQLQILKEQKLKKVPVESIVKFSPRDMPPNASDDPPKVGNDVGYNAAIEPEGFVQPSAEDMNVDVAANVVAENVYGQTNDNLVEPATPNQPADSISQLFTYRHLFEVVGCTVIASLVASGLNMIFLA